MINKKIFKISIIVISIILVVGIYGVCYIQIPSKITIFVGREETLDFGVPVTGQIYRSKDDLEAVAVNANAVATNTERVIDMRLGKSVKVCSRQENSYILKLNLFGFIPLKEIKVESIEEQLLVPIGIPIGIYVKTEGVLVIGVGAFRTNLGQEAAPARYLLKPGDYIVKLNDSPVVNKKKFMEAVSESQGKTLKLTILREENVIDLEITPVLNEENKYKLGVWIRDNAQGVGTLTYIDCEGKYGALGHGITDLDTGELLELESGTLYQTNIISVRKGTGGIPGEMTGLIQYEDEYIMGKIHENCVEGIYGEISTNLLSVHQHKELPIALKQEVELGKAKILCTIKDEVKEYEIEITDLNLNQNSINRGIELEIKDKDLLAETGGIIQGMSGAPIIQNGKFVGAVTHVLVNDPTKGYGIFIEHMLEASE